MYNEPLRVATALNNLALAVWNNGDPSRATALLEESVAIKRQAGNRVGMASSLNNLAMLAVEVNDLERAAEYLQETLAIDREVGSPGGLLIPSGIWLRFWRSKVMHERLPRITPKHSKFARSLAIASALPIAWIRLRRRVPEQAFWKAARVSSERVRAYVRNSVHRTRRLKNPAMRRGST
jgi:hypothetical protein